MRAGKADLEAESRPEASTHCRCRHTEEVWWTYSKRCIHCGGLWSAALVRASSRMLVTQPGQRKRFLLLQT